MADKYNIEAAVWATVKILAASGAIIFVLLVLTAIIATMYANREPTDLDGY